MKKGYVRLLALAVCLVMVLGMLPGKARAEKLEGNTMPMMKSISSGDWGSGWADYFFTNFTDLQNLVAAANSDPYTYYYAYYEGYGDLYITSNITIPDNLIVLVYDNDMTLSSGVTMTIDGGYVYVEDETTINGTLNIINYGELGYTNVLYIYGTINLDACLSARDCDALIYGEDRINFGENYYLYLNEWNATAQDILEMCAWGSVSVPNFYVVMEVNEPVTVPAAVTIPGNTTIYAYNTLTFQGNVHLGGELVAYAPVSFGTSVTNQGYIDVWYDDGGTVSFAQPANYVDDSGEYYGLIYVYSYSSTFPAAALGGMSVNDFAQVSYHSEYEEGTPYWSLYDYKGPHQHTVVVDPALAPTCLAYGQTQGSHCATCGEVFVKPEALAPLGHSYTDPWDTTCNVCGAARKVDPAHLTYSMYRMYNPNSGEHFYTGSMEERQNLEAAGWKYEGVGFTFPYSSGDPVYRLYDKYNTMEHLYTMDPVEKDMLLAKGWVYEGIAFNSCPKQDVPQFRMFNPNAIIGAYHFTASVEERDFLISVGWQYQGIGFYTCLQ